MLALIGRRLIQLLPTLFLVSVLIFLLQQLLPGDPATVMAGEERDPEVIAQGTTPIIHFTDPASGVPVNRSRGMMVAGDPPDAQRRGGWGHGQSPRSYGHDGAGGQIAWVDPESGISFCYLTNALDQNVIREGRRKISLSSKAAACRATP